MKLFKPLIIPLFLVLGYLILVSYPYFFSKINPYDSLGAFSLVEEKSEDFKKTGSTSKYLLAGEKIAGKIKSSENNFGILLVRFLQVSPKVTDRVVFRIKEVGVEKWYYENIYNANQFQSNRYFTFGFPIVTDSKDKTYVFEVESLEGTGKNGVSLSPKKPQVALVYKFTKNDLMGISLFSFSIKKLDFIIGNVNVWRHWPILIFALFIYFMRKGKITFANKKKGQSGNITMKPIVKFSNKLIHQFTTSDFYSIFLNTNLKKRLAIGLLIFSIALLYRYSTTLIDQTGLYSFQSSLGNGVGINSFYSLLGNGGDYDYFIKTATCALNFCYHILHQNLLIESTILGIFYKFFGFAGGLKAYLYLMIILSSLVATIPYFILSRKYFFTIGGIIGSLFLATSDYFTRMSLSLPPDNLSLFFFSMFYIVYLLTMQYGTIKWLLFFGLMGAIDTLNKLMLLPNDLVALIFFIPVFFYEKAKKIKKFPFVKFNLKLIFYSLLPFLVFLVIHSIWESIVEIKFHAPYYLRAMIENGSTYLSRTDVASDSINIFSKGILEILYYYVGLAIVMQKRIIEYAGLNTLFLAPVFFGLLFFTFKKARFIIVKLISAALFLSAVFVLLVLFRDNYSGIQEIETTVNTWPNNLYTNIFLFTGIIFFFLLNFKYSAIRLIVPILPYYLILIIVTKNAPWGRMWAHVVLWSIILLAFLIDWMLNNVKKDYVLKKMWIGPLLLALFIFYYTIPKQANMIAMLYTGSNNYRNEISYLRWVNSELPKEAIILGGGKSDLVSLGENIQKPIIYSTLWSGALLIKPNEIPGIKPTDWNIVSELKNKDNFKKNKYLILEDDIDMWRNRMAGIGDNLFTTSSAALLNENNYSIKVYKFNSNLRKGIYELTNTSN